MMDLLIRFLLHPAAIPAIVYFIYQAYKTITKKNEL